MRSDLCVRLVGAAVVVTAAALSVDWQGAQAAPQAPQATTAVPAPPRINALVVNGGCCHNYGLQAQALMDAINRALPVDWTVAYQGGRGTRGAWPIYRNPKWADGFDLVVHNECSADVADEQLIRTVTQAHRPGPPALVIHCAMHTFRAAAFDDWREFLGVTSRRHTAQHNIKVKVAEGVPPQFAGFTPDWTTPVDELYVIEKLWPGARAIASAVSPEDQKEYPLAWTHDYNGTRVFGTTLGHGNDTWNDPVFQDLMVRAFKWALNRAP